MASITNTSSTNSTLNSLYGIKSNGIGGLASGLDTDSLIEAMTTGTRSKIAKQQQKKQTYQWQMSGLQGISAKLLAFSNKFISMTSASSLRRSTLFSNRLVTAKGSNADAVSITGASKGSIDFSIQSAKMAQNALLTSNKVTNESFSTENIFNADGTIRERFVDQLEGSAISINYNGKDYAVVMGAYDQDANGNANSTTRTAAQMAEAFNQALAKVKLDPDNESSTATLADKIKMTATGGTLSINKTSAGDTSKMKVTDGSSILLDALGIKKANASDAATDSIVASQSFDDTGIIRTLGLADMQNKNITFSYNGTSRSISTGSFTNLNQLKENLQKNLDKAFGGDSASGTQRINVSVNGGKLEFESVDADSKLELTGGDADIVGKNKMFGIVRGGNRFNLKDTLESLNLKNGNLTQIQMKDKDGNLLTNADGSARMGYGININGVDLYFDKDTSVGSMINQINKSDANVKMSYSAEGDKFLVESSIEGFAGKVEFSDIAGASSGMAASLFQGSTRAGKDAEMVVEYDNGTTATLKNDNNNFTIDGVTVTVKKAFDATVAGGGDNITLDTNANSDEVVDIVKSMVEDFNAIIDLINSEVSTKPDRDYPPLSDEQKKDMSEKEITEWEAKARKGVLFGDTDLRSLASDLRFIFSSGIEGVGNFSEIGINIGSSYKDNGKISLDETKLRQALTEDPEKVSKMFTQSKLDADSDGVSGVAEVLKGTIEKYAKAEGYYKGILVSRAGIADQVSESSSFLQKQVDSIDEVIKRLKEKLQTEHDRYQAQFTNLERVISQLNSQSSWLSSQMG